MEIAVAHSLGWGSAGNCCRTTDCSDRLEGKIVGDDRAQRLEDLAMNWRPFGVALQNPPFTRTFVGRPSGSKMRR
jgi:hypothetical protein